MKERRPFVYNAFISAALSPVIFTVISVGTSVAFMPRVV